MHRYHKLGSLPAKRHTIFKNPAGGIYYEELKGNKGFTGPSSLLYHIHRPTAIKSERVLNRLTFEQDEHPPVSNRHFRTSQLKRGGSAVLDRTPVLFNNDVSIWMAYPDKEDDFYFRNGQADELVYINHGSGTLETIFGDHPYKQGDYLVIPRGIDHRYRLDKVKQEFLICESPGELRTPNRYRNCYGQLIERSPYSERDFHPPTELNTIDKKQDTPLILKQRNLYTELILACHPFDVVGWDGYYYPYVFSIYDFEPIVGRIHEPPPVHQTFEGHNFIVCSFCPRPYDFDPQAVPAPYHHSNVMSDEVIFYAKDKFMSRKGIELGSITLHPDGLAHGPHPGLTEKSIGKTHTDELAVMIDTFYPLHITKQALEIEDEEYPRSWLD